MCKKTRHLCRHWRVYFIHVFPCKLELGGHVQGDFKSTLSVFLTSTTSSCLNNFTQETFTDLPQRQNLPDMFASPLDSPLKHNQRSSACFHNNNNNNNKRTAFILLFFRLTFPNTSRAANMNPKVSQVHVALNRREEVWSV